MKNAPARWLAARQTNFRHKKRPYRVFLWVTAKSKPLSGFLSLLITLRALCLLISSPTAFIPTPYVKDATTLGYTVEGVLLVLMAHSLRVLHFNLRRLTAHHPCCLERLATPWVSFGFPSFVVI